MIRIFSLAAISAALIASGATAQATADGAGEARVLEILKTTPLIDGHNDLPWALREKHGNDPYAVDLTTELTATGLHTDIPRLRAGGVGAQLWSVYVPADITPVEAAKETFEQIDTVRRIVAAHPDVFELATTADDIERIQRSGKIASLIGMEGGYSIDDSLVLLREFCVAGARYMTLTHSKTTTWADSATDAPKWGGLNPFGEAVVHEMNRIGMMVDLSHVSEETMLDAIRVSDAPVIFSHSSARAVANHKRNVPDNVLRLLPQNGGIVMVTFVPASSAPPSSTGIVSSGKKPTASMQTPRPQPSTLGSLPGRRLIRDPTPQSPTSSPTSSMSGKSPGSIMSGWAATSTAYRACQTVSPAWTPIPRSLPL